MKKPINLIVLLSFVVFYSCSMFKQTVNIPIQTTASLLQNTEWEMNLSTFNVSYKIYEKYEKGKILNRVVYNLTKKEDKVESMYYLSDNIESFDSTKVGRLVNGKYIIVKSSPIVFVFEIKKIDEKELILQNVNKDAKGPLFYHAVKK